MYQYEGAESATDAATWFLSSLNLKNIFHVLIFLHVKETIKKMIFWSVIILPNRIDRMTNYSGSGLPFP